MVCNAFESFVCWSTMDFSSAAHTWWPINFISLLSFVLSLCSFFHWALSQFDKLIAWLMDFTTFNSTHLHDFFMNQKWNEDLLILVLLLFHAHTHTKFDNQLTVSLSRNLKLKKKKKKKRINDFIYQTENNKK